MTIDPREKVVLFIDGANLYATSKAIGVDIDYRRLLAEFQSKSFCYAPTITRRSSRIRNIPPSAR